MTSDTPDQQEPFISRFRTKLDIDMIDAAMAATSNISPRITRNHCEMIIYAAMKVLAKASQTSPYSRQKLAQFYVTAVDAAVESRPLTMEELVAAFHKAKASVIDPRNKFTQQVSNRSGMTDTTHGWHNAEPKQLHDGQCLVPKEVAERMRGDKN